MAWSIVGSAAGAWSIVGFAAGAVPSSTSSIGRTSRSLTLKILMCDQAGDPVDNQFRRSL
jgi:hypothetical protein